MIILLYYLRGDKIYVGLWPARVCHKINYLFISSVARTVVENSLYITRRQEQLLQRLWPGLQTKEIIEIAS